MGNAQMGPQVKKEEDAARAPASAKMTHGSRSSPADRVMSSATALRLLLATPDASRESLQAALEQHLGCLEEGLRWVLAEHEGMGNELIQVYEQLGIVFEVTRRLASVSDEHEVLALFVECLRPMFHECRFVTTKEESVDGVRVCLWDEVDFSAECVSELQGLVRRSVQERRVVVEEGQCPCAVKLMVGPIFAGETLVTALIIIRHEDSRPFASVDMLLMDSLCMFCGDIIRNLRLVHELRQVSINMVRALVETIDQKDGYTSGHSNRVGYYACLLGQALGWPDARLQTLEWAALLHDVGKIGIRDDVLKKQGKLTSDEFAHMKEHPVRSSEVVSKVPQLAEAVRGVLHHHEHYDGGGYPDGLVGEEIPLEARIIQVADVFDALTTSRSYRKAFTWQKALSILREEAGGVVDPNLAKLFERIILERRGQSPERFDMLFEANARATESEPPAPPGDAGEGWHNRGEAVIEGPVAASPGDTK